MKRIRVSARGHFVAYGLGAIATVIFALYGVMAAAIHIVRNYPLGASNASI